MKFMWKRPKEFYIPLVINPKLIHVLKKNDYYYLRYIPNRGICGLQRMLFTVGLFYGLDYFSKEGRYCFTCLTEAKAALKDWDGIGDPDGMWLKHKGESGEYDNSTLNTY
jgi:hypothetical protein